MSNKDWIEQLQSRLDAHEEPVPDGLWQDIESRLPQRSKAVPLWLRYAAAAAVAGAVIGVGGLLWRGGSDTAVETPAIALTPPEKRVPEPEAHAQNNATNPDVDAPVASPPVAQARPVNHLSATVGAGDSDEHLTQADIPSETPSAQSTSESQTVKKPEEKTEQPAEKPSIGHIKATSNHHVKGNTIVMPSRERLPVSLDFYASNTIKPEHSSGREMAGFYRGVFDYHLFGSIQLYDSIYPPVVKRKTGTHHVPYSLGISVRVPLNDRLALTCGLVYTRLKSDFSSGQKEQILHYLGVPLGVTYTLWGYKRFSVYGIGGFQADFNVKATVKQPSTINSLNLAKDRVQFSALAGPGFQLDLSQDFSIYVEPTARYYFDNGSDIENYFKDKPWNINLNAGLRLTLQ